MMKACNKCGVEKPATREFFHKHSRFKDGLRKTCIQCRSVKKVRPIPKVEYKGELVDGKECSKCKVLLPANTDYFNKDERSFLGYESRCKACNKKYRETNKERIAETKKEYYEQNKEVISEKKKVYQKRNKKRFDDYKRQWYQENKDTLIKEYRKRNKERIAEVRKKYNEEHTEERRKYRLKYYAENKDKLRETKREYNKRNKERCIAYTQKRNALKRSLPATYTIEEWEITKKFFNDSCAYCGKKKKLAQDHFIPLSDDGEYTINNIVPACKSCNSSKHNKNFFEWYPDYKHYSTARMKRVMSYLGYKELDENTLLQQLTLL